MALKFREDLQTFLSKYFKLLDVIRGLKTESVRCPYVDTLPASREDKGGETKRKAE
jgi:hypothetical protein